MAIASFIVSIVAILISGVSVWYVRKEYLSHLRPELWTNWYHPEPSKNQISFQIANRSQNTAIITNIVPISKNITLHQPFHRFELTNASDDSIVVTCLYSGTDMDMDVYSLKIQYQDREGNKYCAVLYAGKGELYIK